MNSLSHYNELLNTFYTEAFKSVASSIVAPTISQLSSLQYADFVQNLDLSIRQLIRDIFVRYLEKADLEFRNSPGRTNLYHVKNTRNRTIVTVFGPITFKRTEYIRLDTKESYCYVDRKIALGSRQKYDCCIQAMVRELYADHNSMIKVGKIIGERIYASFSFHEERKLHALPRQTVYNILHSIKKINVTPEPFETTPETLYIMSDEKYIPLQGECTDEKPHVKEMVKVAVSFEGRSKVQNKKSDKPSNRYSLNNKHIFAACNSDINSFWQEYLDELSMIYDFSKIKKIYVLGDGASWIKNGCQYMKMPDNKVKFALDRYHAVQAIHRMTTDSVFREVLTRYLYETKWDEFNTVIEIIRSYISKDRIGRFETQYNYIKTNWNHFKTMMHEVKIGCAMEQAISHIIASPFTSVPKAYGRKNLPLYLNSRILKENNYDIIQLYLIARDLDENEVIKETYDFSIFESDKQNETYKVNLLHFN